MGKSTISMAIFNSFLYVYQRVSGFFSPVGWSFPNSCTTGFPNKSRTAPKKSAWGKPRESCRFSLGWMPTADSGTIRIWRPWVSSEGFCGIVLLLIQRKSPANSRNQHGWSQAWTNALKIVLLFLVGGLQHGFYFSIYWEYYVIPTEFNIIQRCWNHPPVLETRRELGEYSENPGWTTLALWAILGSSSKYFSHVSGISGITFWINNSRLDYQNIINPEHLKLLDLLLLYYLFSRFIPTFMFTIYTRVDDI